MISPRARSVSPRASIIASRPTRWRVSPSPAAAPIGAWRRGWAAARAMPSRLAFTARPAGVRPISPRRLLSPNHWMSTDRFAVGDHLTANFNAQSYGGRLEGGYRFGTPYGGLTPYAAIQAQSFHTPGYTETDTIAGGFGLAFAARDATDTRSELRGRFAWAHDWVSDPTLLPVFQALPGASFIVDGATPAKNSTLTSAGTELRLANGVTLLAKFDGEFASHSSTYAGTGTFRYRW